MKQKLRIWHNSNLGHESFYKEVKDLQTALLLLDTLADYDLYQGDKVVANAQGLEEFIDGEWQEWYDKDGNDVEFYRNT